MTTPAAEAPSAADSVDTRPARPRSRGALIAYQLAIIVPLAAWLVADALGDPESLFDPILILWAVTIAIVDLLPIPTSTNLHFSLSFPLQLAVALLYPPSVAGIIALAGTSDAREFRRQISPLKALFIRSEIALSVLVESILFHQLATVASPWYQLGGAVALATAVGYVLNVVQVGLYARLDSGKRLWPLIREMHSGVFGEFVVSYMGLALFGVIIATFFVKEGVWSIAVFVAPMAFARQMFARTHSLREATAELEAGQREKEHQATHDALTGLPNRAMFLTRLEAAIGGAEDGVVAVMILDLDHFKEVNDTLGHHYGDLLLCEIRPRIAAVLRGQDTVARLGGDEFGIVAPGVDCQEDALEIAQRILEQLERPISVEGFTLDVSGSVGVALYPQHGEAVETLLRRADVAMYAAKESGSGVEIFSDEHDRYNPARLALLGQIRSGIDRREFILHYQPKSNLADGTIDGVEALVRWDHPTLGLIPPDEFIPLAERSILLRPLTLRIFEDAIAQCHEWDRMGLGLSVSVNLSVRSLLDAGLPEQIEQLLKRRSVHPSSLVIEITESSLMADPRRSVDILDRLSAIGVRLSVDDFGTGYSSLSYLKRLPVDEIKIDKSFVLGMVEQDWNTTIVRATVDLSHNLGLRVVAEGVENEATYRRLREFGCDAAQGFYIGHPVPPEEIAEWLMLPAPREVRTGDPLPVLAGDP